MFSYLIPASASQRLRDIEALLEHMPQYQAQEAAWRLERVVQWHDKARTFLPLARKILGAA